MKIQKYLSQSPIFALYQTQGTLIDHLQQMLAHEGVHLLQALILTALFFEKKEVRPGDLVKTFRISKSNLSHALRGLERQTLIRRSIHGSDARGYLFVLTQAGGRKSALLVKLFDQIQRELESEMGVRSFRDFVQNLERLVSVYKRNFFRTKPIATSTSQTSNTP